VDTALVVACISAVVALASAAFSGWTQLQVSKREKESRLEERRSEAKVVLDRYRGPLLDAAWQLGDRVENIRKRDFLRFLKDLGSTVERGFWAADGMMVQVSEVRLAANPVNP